MGVSPPASHSSARKNAHGSRSLPGVSNNREPLHTQPRILPAPRTWLSKGKGGVKQQGFQAKQLYFPEPVIQSHDNEVT